MSAPRLTGSVVEFHTARGWARVLGGNGVVYTADVVDVETPLAVGDRVEFTGTASARAQEVRRAAA